MSVETLYQEIILDHYRSPRNKGELTVPPAHKVEGFNPLCGDEVVLYLDVNADGVVEDLKINGQGCSISQASISVMSELVAGGPVSEAEELGETFRALMHARGQGLDAKAEDRLGDATAFTGVARYPARIKCALIGWAALRDALIQSGVAGTTQEENP